MAELPEYGHLKKDRGFRVAEPLERSTFIRKGRHVILGRRGNSVSLDSLIFLGKVIEHNQVQDKFDANIWLDISFPHVVFLSGTRGSGKSFDIGVITEGLGLTSTTKVATEHKSLSVVLFDLQNQFWTLALSPDKSLSEDSDHLQSLQEWGLQPASIENVRLIIPPGDTKIIGSESTLNLSTADLSADDLCSFWGTDIYTPQGHLIFTLIDKVSRTGYTRERVNHNGGMDREKIVPNPAYEIGDLVKCLQTDAEILATIHIQVAEALAWRLQSLENTKLFSARGMNLKELLRAGQVVVLLLRGVDDATKALITGIMLKKIYSVMGDYHTRRKVFRRLKKKAALDDDLPERVWAIIDEAHVICPTGLETSATRSAIEYVKRGRDAGLSLVLATQQPSAVDTRVLSQVDLNLVHRLTYEGDISAALARIPANLPAKVFVGTAAKDPRMFVRLLEPGEVIIGDSQSDRAILGVIRPRLTAHGGSEPK
jgi:hypothetical protein